MSPTSLSRRDFLRLSAVTTGGLLLYRCNPLQIPAATSNPGNYYEKNREKILEDVRGIFKHIEKVTTKILPDEDAGKLSSEALSSFELILPDLPYIGGEKNELTSNLYQTAGALAFYRAMQTRGYNVEKTGEILFFAIKSLAGSMVLAGISGRLSSTQLVQETFKAEAERSHQRIYQQDWVFDFIPGISSTFDYGIDYIECGICKYLKAQAASELAPYMCLLDFPISAAMNTGLVRTGTLAHGNDRCDFRYKSGRPEQMEWMPDFLNK
ncbi:MAG: L-2-amino-thiazoline-4-carboxylic acid hydrolase [Anaerolineaceae bacterium]